MIIMNKISVNIYHSNLKKAYQTYLPKITKNAKTMNIFTQPDINNMNILDAYTAVQIKEAYLDININNSLNVRKSKIAIIIAYTYPNLQNDLNTFWASPYGMNLSTPAPILTIYTMPGATENSGWAIEECLDVQMVCAINPNAEVYVVEATSSSVTDLLDAINYASTTLQVDVISMSWGSDEFSGQQTYNSYFSNPKICYCASSGDTNSVSYPSTYSNVIAVGGSTLKTITPRTESAWQKAGSGYSTIYPKPIYQYNIPHITKQYRAVPDVALIANPSKGVWIYYNTSWYHVGGTSVGCPIFASILTIGIQKRLNNNEQMLTSVYPNKTNLQTYLYKSLLNKTLYCCKIFNDIIEGTDGNYPAQLNYDLATGLGSPNIATFCKALQLI